MKLHAKSSRRRFLARSFGAAGALALSGCDALSRTDWFPKVLGTGERLSQAAHHFLLTHRGLPRLLRFGGLGHTCVIHSQDDARIRHLEPEQLKRQIFMATRALVERRLATGPLVLVVEDLHWADAASIELIGAVADRLADRPLLVLLMYRPTLEPDALGLGRCCRPPEEGTTLSSSPLHAAPRIVG